MKSSRSRRGLSAFREAPPGGNGVVVRPRVLLLSALLQLAMNVGITRLQAQDTVEVTITGVLRDSGGAVIPLGYVVFPALRVRVQADSTGRFHVPLRATPGCYELVARQIGFGPTVQAVHLRPGIRIVDAGPLPLQPAPIPEARAFVIGECVPNARTRYGADWRLNAKDSAP